jgi:ATP-dependent protease ClpP protease subunit
MMTMTNLRKLLNDNRARALKQRSEQPRWVSNAANETTLYLYDAIVATEAEAEWWGGVSAEALVPQIRQLDVENLHLRISSPGGDVFAATAISQAIRDCKAHVTAHVDGYAASAATPITLAADETEIAVGGFFMIHNAWMFAVGNSADMLDAASLLEKVDGSLAQTYADVTGKKIEEIRALMDAETWFTAAEAVAFGFIDRIAEGAKAKASWDMSAYAKAPKAPPADPVQPSAHATEDHRARQLQRMQLLERI